MPNQNKTDKVFFKEAYVNALEIDWTKLTCPSCQNHLNLMLTGYSMIPREEIIQDDEHVSYREEEDKKSFDVKEIMCLNCHTKTYIIDPLLFEMQKSNTKMAEILQDLNGTKHYLN